MSHTECERDLRLGRWIAVAAALSLALYGLVALLHRAAPHLVRNGALPWPEEVYPGCAALGLLLVGGLAAARRRDRLASLLPLACIILFGLALLPVTHVATQSSWDYSCYLRAGQDLRRGWSVYSLQHHYQYLYSPALATLFSAITALPAAEQRPTAYWIWQVGNYWAALLFLLLLARALRRYGITTPWLWPALAAGLLANVPLQRTLLFSQVNLHVANLILGYLLLATRRPTLAGSLLGVAGVLKTSPLLLLALPVLGRGWKALLGALGAIAAVVVASTAVAGIKPWQQFLPVLLGMHSLAYYRDNSLESLLRASAGVGGLGGSAAVAVVAKAVTLAAVVLLLWAATRPKYRAVFAFPAGDLLTGALPFLLVAMVVGSPLVWEHHWVFLQLPFCLLVARAWGTPRALPALLSYALVYLIPTFDAFPLSYHRLGGLVLWVVLVHGLERDAEAHAHRSAGRPASAVRRNA